MVVDQTVRELAYEALSIKDAVETGSANYIRQLPTIGFLGEYDILV